MRNMKIPWGTTASTDIFLSDMNDINLIDLVAGRKAV